MANRNMGLAPCQQSARTGKPFWLRTDGERNGQVFLRMMALQTWLSSEQCEVSPWTSILASAAVPNDMRWVADAVGEKKKTRKQLLMMLWHRWTIRMRSTFTQGHHDFLLSCISNWRTRKIALQ